MPKFHQLPLPHKNERSFYRQTKYVARTNKCISLSQVSLSYFFDSILHEFQASPLFLRRSKIFGERKREDHYKAERLLKFFVFVFVYVH